MAKLREQVPEQGSAAKMTAAGHGRVFEKPAAAGMRTQPVEHSVPNADVAGGADTALVEAAGDDVAFVDMDTIAVGTAQDIEPSGSQYVDGSMLGSSAAASYLVEQESMAYRAVFDHQGWAIAHRAYSVDDSS